MAKQVDFQRKTRSVRAGLFEQCGKHHAICEYSLILYKIVQYVDHKVVQEIEKRFHHHNIQVNAIEMHLYTI
jgi:hypothetical protein